MSIETSRFEIRNGVKTWEKHNPMIQAAYDTTDRMAALFGEITFGDLFTQRWSELVPRVLPKIATAASYGLISDPVEVTILFESFQKYYPEMTFKSLADLMNEEDPILPKKAWASIYKLWNHHGIRLPEISRSDEQNALVKKSIDQMVELAYDFTYRSIFEIPRAKDLKAAMEAIQEAKAFVIFIAHNSLCCTCGGGTCQCTLGLSTNFCAIYNGQCTIGSTNCLGQNRPF